MKKLIALFALVVTAAVYAGDITDTKVWAMTKDVVKYADGTQVLDGEFFALVYSADGAYSADAVKAWAQAKDGKCPFFTAALSKAEKDQGGCLALYVLDTRVFPADGGATTLAEVVDGKPSVVAQTALVDGTIEIASAKGVNGSTTGDYASVALPEGESEAKITGFEVKDGKAYIKIAASAYDRVDVATGDAPDAIAADGDAPKSGNGGVITIVKPATADKGFFKVIRK